MKMLLFALMVAASTTPLAGERRLPVPPARPPPTKAIPWRGLILPDVDRNEACPPSKMTIL